MENAVLSSEFCKAFADTVRILKKDAKIRAELSAYCICRRGRGRKGENDKSSAKLHVCSHWPDRL